MKWEEVTLGEVLVQNTEYVTTLEDRPYPKLSVRLYGRGVELDRPADGAAVLMQKHQLAKAGQVIVSEIWAKKGAVGVVPDKGEGALITSHFFLFDVLSGKVDPRWLHYLFRGNYLESALSDGAKGTTSKAAIRPQVFLKTPIPLPPIDEQHRIVAKLDAAAERIPRIEAAQSANAEDFDAFFISAHESAANGKSMKIGEFLELCEDAETIEPDEMYPQVGVRSFGAGLFTKEAISGSSTSYRTFNRLFSGAIVLSQVKGWEGALAVAPSSLDGWFVSPEYRTFRCIEGAADPDYLSFILTREWFWSRLGDATRGVGARRERVRPERFLNVSIPMSRIEDQKRLLAAFRGIARLRSAQQARTTDLAALMPALLDRAFKGEL